MSVFVVRNSTMHHSWPSSFFYAGGAALPRALRLCLSTHALQEVREVQGVQEVRPSGSNWAATRLRPSRLPLKRPPLMSHDWHLLEIRLPAEPTGSWNGCRISPWGRALKRPPVLVPEGPSFYDFPHNLPAWRAKERKLGVNISSFPIE